MRVLPAQCSVDAVALSPSIVATVIEDGAVLLDLDSKYFYTLNASAWAIVQLFETDGASFERILDICAQWGGTDQEELSAFLRQLSDQNIVEPAAQSGFPSAAAYAGPWQTPIVARQAEPLQSIVTSAFDPSIPLAE